MDLKRYLISKGLTIIQFEAISGIRRSNLYRAIHGKKMNPENVRKLHEASHGEIDVTEYSRWYEVRDGQYDGYA